MNAIETQQLTRIFGSVRAVDSANLDVSQGTVFGLLGPNGAGKSTLLKLLIGHLRPTSGTASVFGQAVAKQDASRWQRMGYLAQGRYLPGWMTATECLRFVRAFRSRWDDAKAAHLINRLELPLNTKIRDLSRGHYVRLQIVLAMAHNPDLILFDEPTSGLDPMGRRELLGLLIDEIGQRACTVLFSSHLVEDIERMADTVAIMDTGKIVASGPVDVVKSSRRRIAFSHTIGDSQLSAVPGLIALKREPRGTIAVTSEPENAIRFLRSQGAADAAILSGSLEQTFFDYVRKGTRMIRELLWKEWRENRWKYATLWLVFNTPVLILTLLIGLSPTARIPFADLSDKTVMKYLPLPLGEGFLVASIFLLATAFVAVATFRPEIEDKAVFFVFEQPVSRTRYVTAKLLIGACHVTLAACFAILLAPAVVYSLMLISGKVTIVGSSGIFGAIMGAAARAMPWCSLASLVAFTGAALISTVVPRWWLATICAILFILLFGYYVHGDSRFSVGSDFFAFAPTANEKSMSVSANLGTGTTQWLTVSDVFPMPTAFAPWKWLPFLTSTLLIGLFSVGIALVYERKELK